GAVELTRSEKGATVVSLKYVGRVVADFVADAGAGVAWSSLLLLLLLLLLLMPASVPPPGEETVVAYGLAELADVAARDRRSEPAAVRRNAEGSDEIIAEEGLGPGRQRCWKGRGVFTTPGSGIIP
ncbi:hypothetical protein MAPG_02379, partial [Magnaporthiopsis poae ATCC 64411]